VSAPSRQLVTYLRVSTLRQGQSGLGLEAQRATVGAYAASTGQTIAAEYVEVESGARGDRPQLAAALAACRLRRATLCIAKLDRLSRSVAFTSAMMNDGVDFVACDMPHANRLTLHIMAAMAEHERHVTSERTKAALAAARARGVRLGNPRGAAHLVAGCRDAANKGARARQAASKAKSLALAPLLAQIQGSGLRSSREIALELNRRGVPSLRGVWYPQQVRRLLQTLP
jgi:DNA invertase Pin-like site-specific DNA recombinase